MCEKEKKLKWSGEWECVREQSEWEKKEKRQLVRGQEVKKEEKEKREVVCEGVVKFFLVLEKERVVCERSQTRTARPVPLGGETKWLKKTSVGV